ncbi:BTAD domain-containing putative transcriptional regulator [Nocardiopsis suaedae]|uniref:BTAD domain-containing putative transcriptional regulator n=1 Tax=Nocardiopsis suaedae TaxID=3018444 RepID=A0ABT4TSP0_9ACTN|nr:BTAD domain-containing putative transcriptional regulator [Nocardiopsis suaedae]MDA2807714.1 BTAD domain-containing putative transcriptional regulator [Nocardiopsis suaedae]
MRFGVLGPLDVRGGDGGPVAVPEGKVRALLADLLVHGGRPVPADRLVEDLWPGRAPGRPLNTLQTKVSQLRKFVGADRVLLSPAGYRLRVGEGEVDADLFERAVAGGALTEALGMWRGPAYAEFAEAPFARAEAARLEELRLTAVEELAAARAESGGAAAMAGELGALARAHPLRERLHGLYMLALYQAGRQGEALEAYEGLRRRLRDELGVDPGPEAAGVHARLLRGRVSPSSPASAPRGGLPCPPTALIGREEDAARVRAALRAPDAGVPVTVTGPGGVGKTRLALEVARSSAGDFPDGVWVVELAGLDRRASASDVAERVVTALGLCDGAADDDADDLVEWCRSALDGRRCLLVLDNCEHVIDAVAALVAAVASADGVRTAVTSQEALGMPGETVLPLAPLPDADAVRLFAERARAADPGFALTAHNAQDVAAVCRRLDGIPLAVELVAARMRSLTPAEAAAGLDDRFALPTGPGRGRPSRQRTLRSMIDWSWGLLDGGERAVLRRLAVHRDGWTADAARAVCPGAPGPTAASGVLGVLSCLVDRSLVVREGGRYRLLESVAAYCADRLEEAGETGEVRRRFTAFHVEHAERTGPGLCGGGQREALGELDAETVNKRAALEEAVRAGDAEGALRLAGALAWFWRLRNRVGEARRSLDAALAVPGGPPAARALAEAWRAAFDGRVPTCGSADPGTRARLLWCARMSGAPGGEVAARVEEVRARAAAAGDRWAEAAVPVLRAECEAAECEGTDGGGADAACGAELFGALGDRWGRLRGHMALARARGADGPLAEDLRAAEELGLWGEAAEALLLLGRIADARGDRPGARARYARALRIAEEHSYGRGAAQARVSLDSVE